MPKCDKKLVHISTKQFLPVPAAQGLALATLSGAPGGGPWVDWDQDPEDRTAGVKRDLFFSMSDPFSFPSIVRLVTLAPSLSHLCPISLGFSAICPLYDPRYPPDSH